MKRQERTKTVSLIDVDRTGYPNLALMKLSAWHKSKGHHVLELNEMDVAADFKYASTVFSWNRSKAEYYKREDYKIGGSGVDLKLDLPLEVESMRPDYNLYGIDFGWGYLMRGCIWDCSFCIVPIKEGKAREVAKIDDLINHSERKRPFVVLIDNEFFWKESWAIDRLNEFTGRGIDFCPSQGLDIRVMTPNLADALAASPFWNIRRTKRQITFAFDDIKIEKQYRRGVEMLLARMKAWHLQSFVLVGYNSTIEQDLERIRIIKSYGIDPFVMVYRDFNTGQMSPDPKMRDLARWVNRRLHKVCEFKDYDRSARGHLVDSYT